jgi:hypothetical protein
VYEHPPEFLAEIFSIPAGNTSGFPCAIVSCSLHMHVRCCCWHGLAGFSQYYIKILHVFTPIQKNIYICITHTSFDGIYWTRGQFCQSTTCCLSRVKYSMRMYAILEFRKNVTNNAQCWQLTAFSPKLIQTTLK